MGKTAIVDEIMMLRKQRTQLRARIAKLEGLLDRVDNHLAHYYYPNKERSIIRKEIEAALKGEKDE